MNICMAASRASAASAAYAYASLGISVIPLVGKRAAIRWSPFRHHVARTNEIQTWQSRRQLQNVGIVCGRVSKLVVVDLDGLQAVAAFEKQFPDLLDTFTVLTGSGKGKHLYYAPAIIPATTRATGLDMGNVELRSDGCYVVAPPSIHPETFRPYILERALPVKAVPDLESVVQWIRSLTPKPPTQPAISGQIGITKQERTIRFAQAALRNECAALRGMPPGNQNNQLNRAAYNLGQLVGDGLLAAGEVESALLAVAQQIGQSETLSQRTIASGLKAGIANPRSHQWQKRSS